MAYPQIPLQSKRDRDEMMYSEVSFDRGSGERPQDLDGTDSK